MSGGLVVEDLSVHFGGVYALQSMDLTISPGTCVGLTGPNGSGKSTMVNAITGLVRARGHVTVNGSSLRLGVPGAAAARLRRTYQTPRVHAQLTGVENVCTGHPAPEGRNVVGALLRRRRAATIERGRRAAARQALSGSANTAPATSSARRCRTASAASSSWRASWSPTRRSFCSMNRGPGSTTRRRRRWRRSSRELTSNGIAVLLIDHKVGLLNAVCDHLVVLEQGTKLEEGSPAEVWAAPRPRCVHRSGRRCWSLKASTSATAQCRPCAG